MMVMMSRFVANDEDFKICWWWWWWCQDILMMMFRYIEGDDVYIYWWWWCLDILMMMMMVMSRYIEGEDQAVLSLLAVTHFVADWAENPRNEKLDMIKDFLIFTFQAIVKSAPLLISSAKTCQKDGDKLSPLSATMRSVFQWGKHRRRKIFFCTLNISA